MFALFEFNKGSTSRSFKSIRPYSDKFDYSILHLSTKNLYEYYTLIRPSIIDSKQVCHFPSHPFLLKLGLNAVFGSL